MGSGNADIEAHMKADKRCYLFGGGKAEGNRDMKDLLGGKGAGLAEMTNIGLPVPPGFTISTEACNAFYAGGRELSEDLISEIRASLQKVELLAGARFGSVERPLLLSVRSGARASMPGMMDTVLNVGLNERTLAALARWSGSLRFALDCYRRFCAMFGTVVLGIKDDGHGQDPFEAALRRHRAERKVRSDPELTEKDLELVIREFESIIADRGAEIPFEPMDQLLAAIRAVFISWENPRAVAYRQLNKIPSSWGTAVNVQTMVFGNLGEDSATGVAFTRNPATGENELYGEYLLNAQGEDVVAGIRTPRPVAEMAKVLPEAFASLRNARIRLEQHYREMQDIEFTVERKKLYVLQCRAGKRSGFASVRIAVDMADEKLISEREAILRVDPLALEHLLRPVFDREAAETAIHSGRLLAKGLAAGPGAACGRVVFTADDAEAWASKGERVILVRPETSAEDIRGMNASLGFLTQFGGMTSHAALVARQMGKVAIVGCGAAHVDIVGRTVAFTSEGRKEVIREGDWISIDGFEGLVISDVVPTRASEVVRVLVERSLDPKAAPTYQRYAQLMKWADGSRRLGVRANADQADQAAVALALGAAGIGLCRTEHMFFGKGKIEPMREVILAETRKERQAALKKLLPLQRADFVGLFRTVKGLPVTIRTLDPPLHEFLPKDDGGIEELAIALGKPKSVVLDRIQSLREANPMLGHRGCRLGISYPEITAMQARAIFEAACDVASEGLPVHLEVMIPLVATRRELDLQAKVVKDTAAGVFSERGMPIPYKIGSMIEIPRAALTAGEIAAGADFFSFGTNDLTQTTLGLSRDDAGTFLADYLALHVYETDPFQSIDRNGVGRLMKLAVQAGRETKPDLKIGICGEHGGDPASIAFCQELGLNYVSCSPYRIPVARLAAAQASAIA
jgi:pyruvate,orthophosphate dikinase